MHHNPTVYTKGQSITTTLKVNRAKNRFLKQEQGGGGHDSKQPQESKVNVVNLWCHGIPEKIFQIIDKVFHTYLMQELQNYH